MVRPDAIDIAAAQEMNGIRLAEGEEADVIHGGPSVGHEVADVVPHRLRRLVRSFGAGTPERIGGVEAGMDPGEQCGCRTRLRAVQPYGCVRPDAGKESQPGRHDQLIAVVWISAGGDEIEVFSHPSKVSRQDLSPGRRGRLCRRLYAAIR
ncbi:hypothetical protein D9M72_442260 [compost metagenome]